MASEIDIITTQRLYLRGIDEEDAAWIVKWRSDPEVYRFFKSPHRITLEEHLQWFNNNYKHNSSRYDWMCIEKDSGTRAGVFGLVRESECAEINYILAPEAQHKGYATEAIGALIKYAFTKWEVKRIVAEVHRENIPSVVLAKKLGFTLALSDEDCDIYALERTE